MEYPDPFYRLLCSSETLRSSAKGFFHEFSEIVIEEAGDSWIEKTFGKLQTDEDRIRTILTDAMVKNVVLDTLKRVMHLFRDKDATISREKRLAGLKMATVTEHEKALLFLSQAVLRAPPTGKVTAVDQGLSLPLALLARADTLIALGEYNLALQDLQMVDEKGLTTSLRRVERRMRITMGMLQWRTNEPLRRISLSPLLVLKTCRNGNFYTFRGLTEDLNCIEINPRLILLKCLRSENLEH